MVGCSSRAPMGLAQAATETGATLKRVAPSYAVQWPSDGRLTKKASQRPRRLGVQARRKRLRLLPGRLLLGLHLHLSWSVLSWTGGRNGNSERRKWRGDLLGWLRLLLWLWLWLRARELLLQQFGHERVQSRQVASLVRVLQQRHVLVTVTLDQLREDVSAR